MPMEKNEFTGWVKWVIVIAALITIANTLYEAGKGFMAGWEHWK